MGNFLHLRSGAEIQAAEATVIVIQSQMEMTIPRDGPFQVEGHRSCLNRLPYGRSGVAIGALLVMESDSAAVERLESIQVPFTLTVSPVASEPSSE